MFRVSFNMMSAYFLLTTIVLLELHFVHLYPSDKEGLFLNKYNVDVDQVLKSQRLYMSYANCILDKGPCTPEGKTLKEGIPQAMKTECADCSDDEKKQLGKIMSYTMQNHREVWTQIMDKYDSDGSFRRKYEVEDDGADSK